jgi:outer membrane protein assembly factor BamD (BamD/ComL family)
VGYFYLRYRLPPAAIARFEGLLEDYPDYSQRDKALHYLAIAYERAERTDDAEQARARLEAEHPDSPFLDGKG